MPSRPAVKSAFEGLRPSIVREPSRAVIAPHHEDALLQQAKEPASQVVATSSQTSEFAQISAPQASELPIPGLLTKKKREVLIPVTFRIPQTLKEQLNEIAKKHELNQTDLINEGIELNLQRYR